MDDLPPARRNIELKAIDAEPGRSMSVCQEIGADDHGIIWQRDTYFHVNHGGLKMREESPGSPHLIQFERDDQPQQRKSSYRITLVQDADEMRAALTAALGVRGVVEKRRHLFLWQRVRIHLDEVEGLGHFIELEAVAQADSDLTREHQLIVELRRAFSITDERLCAEGYVAQLRANS
jgi:predicted adenylyl cyclase CyaB